MAEEVVNNSCDRVVLSSEDREVCKEITVVNRASADSLGWLAYQHRIDIDSKKMSGMSFGEAACSSLKYCKLWVDPQSAQQIEEEKEFVAVFS